jgi:hypothetical protein
VPVCASLLSFVGKGCVKCTPIIIARQRFGEHFFFKFPHLFAIYNDTFRYIQQMVCWEVRAGRGVLCSIPP